MSHLFSPTNSPAQTITGKDGVKSNHIFSVLQQVLASDRIKHGDSKGAEQARAQLMGRLLADLGSEERSSVMKHALGSLDGDHLAAGLR